MYETLLASAEAAAVDILLTGSVGDKWVRQDGREFEQGIFRGDWRAVRSWGTAAARESPLRAGKRALRAVAKRVLRGQRAETYYEGNADDWWVRTSLETLEREGLRHGILVEHPFCDFEFASLLAGLPPHVRSMPRTPLKLVTREAMRGLLPEVVRTRADNPVSTPYFVAALGGTARDGRPLDDGNVLTEAAAHYVAAWRVITERRNAVDQRMDATLKRVGVRTIDKSKSGLLEYAPVLAQRSCDPSRIRDFLGMTQKGRREVSTPCFYPQSSSHVGQGVFWNEGRAQGRVHLPDARGDRQDHRDHPRRIWCLPPTAGTTASTTASGLRTATPARRRCPSGRKQAGLIG